MGFGGYTGKGQWFPVEVLSAEEVRALMNECSARGACGRRDRAMIAVMYRGGLRLAEVLALEPRDVDLESGVVNVRSGKGGKQRFVGIDEETCRLVGKWVETRGRGVGPISPLFCTLDGAPLSPGNVRAKFKALGAAAGIEKRVHPHGLRHSRAVDLVRRGVSLPVIQRAYGHTSLATTQTYVSHLCPKDVIDAMREP